MAPGGPRLKLYLLGPGEPAGELVGALERMALVGSARVEDGLCVARAAHDGELFAIDLALARHGGGLSDLVDFRLAPERRRVLTATALTTRAGGVPPSTIRRLGAQLEAGTALVAFIVSGGPTPALDDAVARCAGRLLADEPAEHRSLAELPERLLQAAGG